MKFTSDQLLQGIIDYENGEMPFDELVEFVQNLVDTGLAWQLQGSYGRLAIAMIEDGYVHRREV